MAEGGDGKSRAFHGEQSSPVYPPQNQYYGAAQGAGNYYPPQPAQPANGYPKPANGYPQPVPPPAYAGHAAAYPPHAPQTAHGYASEQGGPYREERLPCCGLGLGWFLFIAGFFLGAIPWYVGTFILLCVRMDRREKPGLIGCAILAFLTAIAVTISATRARHSW